MIQINKYFSRIMKIARKDDTESRMNSSANANVTENLTYCRYITGKNLMK